jgi:peptide-methionine (S)-S-oxide reductase
MTKGDLTMSNLEIAVFAGGCFWCIEPVFSQLKVVKNVTSGYTGGYVSNPSYKQISSGETGHVEAVKITFDPSTITFEALLKVFFSSHNPTTRIDRKGNIFTNQYLSAVFFQNEAQKINADEMINELNAKGTWASDIITQVIQATTFYPADNYFAANPNEDYCMSVAMPKVAKIRMQYTHLVR